MKTVGSQSLDAEINVTPMIDVLLVLLVIFMLAQRGRHAFDVNVPPPNDARRPSPVRPAIVLELPAAGGFALNGRSIAAADLPSSLRGAYRDRHVRLLFIRAAATRPYRDVIAAADVARGAGVDVIGYVP